MDDTIVMAYANDFCSPSIPPNQMEYWAAIDFQQAIHKN